MKRCYKYSLSSTNRKNKIYIHKPYFQHRSHKSEPQAFLPSLVTQSIIMYQTPEISVFSLKRVLLPLAVRCNKHSHKFPGISI